MNSLFRGEPFFLNPLFFGGGSSVKFTPIPLRK
ncbi:hypothetical protein predicted by Glimmer/Critica [Helicobacter pylori B8]|uniref:Uncharacterized protein n=1 Tax=Helicobacter pylori (strain B8) TaxID=693745 RepID=D7FG67_HELP3|nr:hypothetical protein predicted by Glimmer/Critica [Helicobacter pylori B8]